MTRDNPYDDDIPDAYRQSHPPVQLQEMSPQEALDIHLNRVREEHATWTRDSHESRLSWFIEWCRLEDIDDLNDLTGRDILRFRDWRRQQNKKDPDDVPIARSTLKAALDTLRVFLKNAARANGVHPWLPHQIDPPTLSKEDARDIHISADRAHEILEYQRKYEYCEFQHICFEVIWHTGMRMGAARSLDLSDCNLGDDPYLELEHEPDEDTPLKNGVDGERPVAISDNIARLLRDWRDDKRPDVEDEYGREPLLATNHGRASRTTIRNAIYACTRPCKYGDECPHDREPAECEPAKNKNRACLCPGSVSPHPIRRSAITHWLDRDWRRAHVSERADVSEKIIEEHYDEREDIRKMEQRRQNLDRL